MDNGLTALMYDLSGSIRENCLCAERIIKIGDWFNSGDFYLFFLRYSCDYVGEEAGRRRPQTMESALL